ncbi:hypothetical protein SH139x_005760 [Planctomycetaceae bacterium SH139]
MQFVDDLAVANCYLIISFSHLCELLRHQNDDLVYHRLRFLGRLPLIAWPRPYDRSWFVGSTADIGRRELHHYVHQGIRGLKLIRDSARNDFWETGYGGDMFPQCDDFWNLLIGKVRESLGHDRYVASFARTVHPEISKLTIGEARRIKRFSNSELPVRVNQLATQLESQVLLTGDKSLRNVHELAIAFAEETRARAKILLANDENIVSQVCKQAGVPEALLRDDMTICDLGELAVLAGKLRVLASGLVPAEDVDLATVPPGSLPTITMDRTLIALQQKAHRTSGSDLGDGQLAALSMYADVTEVDKRTLQYMTQIRQKHVQLSPLIGSLMKTSSYEQMQIEILSKL